MSDFKSYLVAAVKAEDEKIDENFISEFLFIPESKEQFLIPINKLVEWKVDCLKSDAKKRLKKGLFKASGKANYAYRGVLQNALRSGSE
jgi:hypothetical protein